jgi:peptidoglycan/xylan/chitin deacetylase (PgdA/CDA1 family)
MFERMLDTILDLGYAGCSLSSALAQRGRRRVAITFDDATLGQFEHAVPALLARGMTATVFVTTDWVGRPGYMSWDQLRQLIAWGMSVQSHSRSHPFLSELSTAGLRAELTESKWALDQALGQQTTQIALPGGDAPKRSVWSLVEEAGYTVVAGSRWGINRDGPVGNGPRVIRRCTVRGGITPARARRMVVGDPWIALSRLPREAVLARIRSTLGPSRYARWRRRLLDALAGTSGS